MTRVVLRRLAGVPLVLLAVSAVTFLLMSALPGGPVEAILGTNATAESVAALRAQLGLDEPLPSRFWHWLAAAAQGDLGQSFSIHQPVTSLILERLPVTLELMAVSQVMAVGIAIPLAIVSARRAGGAADRAVSAASFAALAMPTFIIAVVLILVFAVLLRVLPATGYTPIEEGLGPNLRSLLLPSAALALGPWSVYTRLLRREMLTTLGQDFVTVAVAKGLRTRYVLTRHALRPSLFPLVTTAGLTIGTLISGAVLVESIYGLPGLGTLLVNAIYARDYVLVQGIVLFITVAFVVVNALVDIVYAIVDPRVRS